MEVWDESKKQWIGKQDVGTIGGTETDEAEGGSDRCCQYSGIEEAVTSELWEGEKEMSGKDRIISVQDMVLKNLDDILGCKTEQDIMGVVGRTGGDMMTNCIYDGDRMYAG